MPDGYQKGIRVVVIVILILVLVFFIILLITLNVKYRPSRVDIFAGSSAKKIILRRFQTQNKDSMEVMAADVEIHGVIGAGAFGIVKKGILKPYNKSIAVKMLRGGFSVDVLGIGN